MYLKSFRRLTNTVQIARCRDRYTGNYARHTHGYFILANVVPINRIDGYDICNYLSFRYINKNYSKYSLFRKKYFVIVEISKIKSVWIYSKFCKTYSSAVDYSIFKLYTNMYYNTNLLSSHNSFGVRWGNLGISRYYRNRFQNKKYWIFTFFF